MKFNFDIEDIQYLKILYMDNNGNPNTAKAAMKEINDRELTACIPFNDKYSIKIPQIVTLSIICNDGLYRTKTTLTKVEHDPPYFCLIMDSPSGLEYQQNREYFRVDAGYNCAYYPLINGEVQNYTTKTLDISAGGVSIFLENCIFSEETTEMDIMVDERIVHTKLQYIRSEKIEDGYKISFAYTDISSADRDWISQVCIKKQLEERRQANF